MKVPAAMERFVNLTAGGTSYIGPKSLTQFVIDEPKMILISPKHVAVEIIFKRIYMHHVFVTFAPTLVLMIVTQLTLFVDYEEHFDGTIMVHLTTMLVMYTLYASVSSSMPNTAYLKFIDVFMLYGLVLPFVTFVCEVIVMIMKHHENTHARGFEKQNNKEVFSKKVKINNKINIVKIRNLENQRGFAWQDDKEKETENIKVHKSRADFMIIVVRIILPIFTVGFVVTYIILAHALFIE